MRISRGYLFRACYRARESVTVMWVWQKWKVGRMRILHSGRKRSLQICSDQSLLAWGIQRCQTSYVIRENIWFYLILRWKQEQKFGTPAFIAQVLDILGWLMQRLQIRGLLLRGLSIVHLYTQSLTLTCSLSMISFMSFKDTLSKLPTIIFNVISIY